jgi:iron(III) transport system permease protein
VRRLVLGLIAGLLLCFVALPLGLLLPQAGAWERAMDQGDAALHTLLLCLGTAGFALGMGIPVGIALSRFKLPAALSAAVVLPYAIPPYVTTLAWVQLANPTNGLLTGLLPLNIYTLWGMIWVLGLHLSPFVALSVRDALGRLDPALEEAARMSGASPRRVLWDVTVPMLLPALIAATGFVISAAAASFGVPYLLSAAAQEPVPVLTTRIYQALELSPSAGHPLAVGLALALLVLGVGLPSLLGLLRGGRSYAGAKPGRVLPQVQRPLITAGVALWLALAVGLPLGSVVVTSLQASFGAGIAPENLSLVHWQRLLGDDRLPGALLRSIGLGVASASGALLVGALIGHAAERSPSRATRALAALARAPYAVPGTVLALALILAWSQEIRLILFERLTLTLALSDTVWILGLAYGIKFLALPLDSSRAALASLHPSLEEAARISGAGWGRTLWDVTLPLLGPALRTAWFLVFLPCFCEMTLSILLRGPRTAVVGTLLFDLQSYSDPQAAAVLALVVAAVVLVGGALFGLRRTA